MFSFSRLIEAVGLTKLQAVLTSEFLPRAPNFFSEKKKKVSEPGQTNPEIQERDNQCTLDDC